METVRGTRHGDMTMPKTNLDDPTQWDYDEYIANALRTEGGHLSIGRGGFTRSGERLSCGGTEVFNVGDRETAGSNK
jgi:hypothetical protein